MRQAGRYLPAYREIRKTHGVLDITKSPELASQVALEPVHTLAVDAAILFADIALPLQAMGFPIDIEKDVGPVTSLPIRAPEDVERLKAFDPALVPFIPETIRRLKEKLNGTPLIGFCGAPYTLASYMIEGRPSKDFAETKAFMWRHPDAWDALLRRLAEGMGAYLRMQTEAGADAVQIFDSWVGALAPDDYASRVARPTAGLFREVRESGVPAIHFGTGTATILPLMREAGGEVLAVDWRLPLDEAWARAGAKVALQGNLDPGALLAPLAVIEVKTRDILTRAGGRPGHIFNLGHGVLAGTPVDHARFVVDRVHALTAGGA
jgi:uroporphyrinogen decarboxylase